MMNDAKKLDVFELCQLDEVRLRALPHEQLQAVSICLLHEFKKVVDRLNQTPLNSSVPPSSLPPWATLTKMAAAAKALTQNAQAGVTKKTGEAAEKTNLYRTTMVRQGHQAIHRVASTQANNPMPPDLDEYRN